METAERAVKTAAQFVVFYLVGVNTAQSSPVNFFTAEFGWLTLFEFALSGLVLSVLTSIISAPVGAKNSPSVLPPTGSGTGTGGGTGGTTGGTPTDLDKQPAHAGAPGN